MEVAMSEQRMPAGAGDEQVAVADELLSEAQLAMQDDADAESTDEVVDAEPVAEVQEDLDLPPDVAAQPLADAETPGVEAAVESIAGGIGAAVESVVESV